MPKEELSPLVMTMGHSTHTLGEFIRLLQAHGATCVVDVRTVPCSRHNPQFNKASLPRSLKKVGFPLWLRLIFLSHQVDERGRESYGPFNIEEAKHPQTILDYELNEGPSAAPKGAPQEPAPQHQH